MTGGDLDDSLIARARAAHVVVIGGGIAGLVAALECAKVGIPVTVLEASARLGGSVRTVSVAGLAVDTGADAYATRGGTVEKLIDELGLTGDVAAPSAARGWIAGLPAGAAPAPAGGLLGIPDNPWASDVRRVIGWRGAWRAYLDRLRPPLTIGHEHSLGALVRGRMGDRVVDRLVTPIVMGASAVHPDALDADAAAPGLNAALTRVGSLAGAVAVVRGERDPVPPGGPLAGLPGGLSRLVDALAERLRELGVQIRTDVRVDGLDRRLDRGEGGWVVRAIADDEPLVTDADAVIIATDEPAARSLLAEAGAEVPPGDARDLARVDTVTLVIDAPELDARPRGTSVVTVPGSHRARALTHMTAKWGWLADAARAEHPHRHILRVSFGPEARPATVGLSDGDAVALALSEASVLLGIPLDPGQLVDTHLERFTQGPPATARGFATAAQRARDVAHRIPNLGVTGAWLAGSGLAQVIPDAMAEAERVRGRVLWGAESGEQSS